jgi:hypothetical protein
MTHTTQVACIALEWWRASSARTEDRLRDLVAHVAATNGETEHLAYHEQSAIRAVREWEWS